MPGLLTDEAGRPIPAGGAETRERVSRWLGHAAMLDIETTGLDPSLPNVGIWQGAVGVRGPSGALEFPVDVLVRPTFRSPHGDVPIPYESVSSWTRASLERELPGGMVVGSRPWTEGIPPGEFVQRALDAVRGKDLWVQNLPFESRHLQANMTDSQWLEFLTDSELEGHAPRWGPGGGLADRRILRSSSLIDRAVAEAWRSSRISRSKAWAQVWPAIREELERDVPLGATRSLDIQDVTRSMFAMAQEAGYMPRTGDVFSGSSVDVFARLGMGVAEQHMARADIELQDAMLERHLSMAERISTGEGLDRAERRYLSAIARLQPEIRRANAARTLADAYESIVRQGRWDVVAGVERGVRIVGGERREFARFVHAPITDISEVARHLREKEEGLLAQGMRKDLRVDWQGMQRRFMSEVVVPHAELGQSLDDLVHRWKTASDVPDSTFVELSMRRGGVAGRMGDWMGNMRGAARRNWKWIAGGAVAAGVIWKMMGGSDPPNWHDVHLTVPEVRDGPPPMPVPEPWEGPEGGRIEMVGKGRLASLALNDKLEGTMMMYVPASRGAFQVEDADTVAIAMSPDRRSVWRLSGIDAPEVPHPGEEYSRGRVWEDQPYGAAATGQLRDIISEMDEVGILFDARGRTTYGRGVGVLVGRRDDELVNINLELVRRGAASALPFGPTKEDLVNRRALRQANADAANGGIGMYSHKAWQIERLMNQKSRRRLTHVSLTMPDRLRDDFQAAATLSHMRHSDMVMSQWASAGTKEDRNILEGMKHGWFGRKRGERTDFGSGWSRTLTQVDRGLAQLSSPGLWERLIGTTQLAALVTRPYVWKKALGVVRRTAVMEKHKGVPGAQDFREAALDVEGWIREQEGRGLARMGLISPGLTGEELGSIILHERVHVFIPDRAKTALHILSNEVAKGQGMPQYGEFYFGRSMFLEEAIAYNIQGLYAPSPEIAGLFRSVQEMVDVAHAGGRPDMGRFVEEYSKVASQFGGSRSAKATDVLSRSLMDRSSCIKHHRMDQGRAWPNS